MTSVCGQNFYATQSQQKYMMAPAGASIVYQQHKQIAPAPSILGMNGSNMMSSNAGPITTKKYTYNNMPYCEQVPSVVRRNARERNRVKQVNNGFATLRQHIPSNIVSALSSGGRGASKKLSKVDTLRMAVEYIRGLQDLIEDCDSQGSSIGSSSPASSYSADDFVLQNSYSDASASPSPSYNSDISVANGYMPISEENIPFKFEHFDNTDNLSADAPVDDDILDYISSWQGQ